MKIRKSDGMADVIRVTHELEGVISMLLCLLQSERNYKLFYFVLKRSHCLCSSSPVKKDFLKCHEGFLTPPLTMGQPPHLQGRAVTRILVGIVAKPIKNGRDG